MRRATFKAAGQGCRLASFIVFSALCRSQIGFTGVHCTHSGRHAASRDASACSGCTSRSPTIQRKCDSSMKPPGLALGLVD
jgi:hypothetical protein